jgi:hypothetical protein
MADPAVPGVRTDRPAETNYTPATVASMVASGQIHGFDTASFPEHPEELFTGGYKSHGWQPVAAISVFAMMKRPGATTAEPYMLVTVRGGANETLAGTAGALTRRPDTPAIYNALYNGPDNLHYTPSTADQQKPIAIGENRIVGETSPDPQPLSGNSGLAKLAQEALKSKLGINDISALGAATISGGPLVAGFVPVGPAASNPADQHYEPIGMQAVSVFTPDPAAFQKAMNAARERDPGVQKNYGTVAWVPVADFKAKAIEEPNGPHVSALLTTPSPSLPPTTTFGGLGLPAIVAQVNDPDFTKHLGPQYALAEQCQVATNGTTTRLDCAPTQEAPPLGIPVQTRPATVTRP